MLTTDAQIWPSESAERYIALGRMTLQSMKEKIDVVPDRDVKVLVDELASMIENSPPRLTTDQMKRRDEVDGEVYRPLLRLYQLKMLLATPGS